MSDGRHYQAYKYFINRVKEAANLVPSFLGPGKIPLKNRFGYLSSLEQLIKFLIHVLVYISGGLT